LEEDVEHCTTDYNQVMATFAENKRDADKREAKQAETIKQLLSKIELKDREIEKVWKFCLLCVFVKLVFVASQIDSI